MNKTLNEVIVHVNENVDAATLDDLEQSIRRDRGVVSVQYRGQQRHLMLVVYDSAVMRASNILRTFQERGLHAQLVGM
jgi:RAB protein geranylgeranyltransferase component A